jgi:hypothetical protein
MNDLLANQTETLVEIQERLKLEIAAREHGEVKVQEIRREKEQLFQIIQEHKDTAEAFQVRIQQIFNMKSNIKSEKKVNCQNLKLSTIKK